MRILAIDPGKNNGIAILDTKQTRTVRSFNTVVGWESLFHFLQGELKDEQFDVVVIEDYIVRNSKKDGGFDHNWDKGYTLRIIGAIKFWAWTRGFPTHLQSSWIKPAMYGKLGLKYVRGAKNMHHIDAMVHGYKYIEDNKLLPEKDYFLVLKGK